VAAGPAPTGRVEPARRGRPLAGNADPADYRVVDRVACPNCGNPLEQHAIDRLYGRSLTIDVCAECQGLWFDEGEVLQSSPRGTLTLFRIISERQQRTARRPLGARLQCPRCAIRLSLVVDQQRATRFQYYRCPRSHGRFMTFFHFLRARNFVRSLTPREVADLRARITQVSCSNCGAPLDLDKDVACGYCRAPISMLDPDQIRATLAELQAADARRQQIDPALPLTLMLERVQAERVFAEAAAQAGGDLRWTLGASSGSGLVESGLATVMRWLASRGA
jgi:Zn-finger nucleic acid-binding protein